MRKRRTRSHIIADLSANHFERHALLCRYTVERMVHDYGVDLLMYTYDENGEVENEQIKIQLKSTDNLSVLQDGQTIAVSVDTADLEYWLSERYPMILVVYDAQTEIAYWLYTQAYFQKRRQENLILTGNTVTLRLSTANIVNAEAVRKFALFKERVLDQLEGVIFDDE